MSLAEDEVDRLLNQKEHLTGHPEDIYHSSDDHSSEFYDDNQDHDHDQPVYSNEDDDDDTNNHLTNAMHGRKSTYHIPTAVFDANTGPKGVISDAQSFERAKKRSFRRTIMGATGWDFSSASRSPRGSPPYSHGRGTGVEHALSDDDEDFMRRWREVRMAELVAGRRKVGPSKRRWGTVEVVDAAGYLDAIEQVMAGTVVVVCIYDPESTESSIVEDCLSTIARKQITTRFVKLHQDVAEMEHVRAPAFLAYRNGDLFATIVDVFRQLPGGRSCSSASLEDLLKEYRIF